MKIALLGYGKMGKAIEDVIAAQVEKHEVVLKVDASNASTVTAEDIKKADVAIEFSTPDTVLANINMCFDAGVPVVVGTTGWYHKFDEICQTSEDKGQLLFYATNFSIGVNIFFQVSKFLAQKMNEQNQYSVRMEEIHHTQKLDAPSGTAITLAEGIIEYIDDKTQWVNESTDREEIIPIVSKRIEGVPGTHAITYESDIDSIEIKHTAHSRMGFAQGAVSAAEWLVGRKTQEVGLKGCFSMKDMLKFEY